MDSNNVNNTSNENTSPEILKSSVVNRKFNKANSVILEELKIDDENKA
jgi:hypothetical protein